MRKSKLGRSVLCCVAIGAVLASQALADYTTTYYSVTRGGSGTGLGYNSWSNCYYDVPHQAGSGVRFDFTIPVQSLTAWVWAGLEGNQPSSYLRVHFGDDSGEWGTEYYSGAGGMILWQFSKTAPSGREITWVRSESQNHVVDAYVNTKVMNLVFCDKDSDGDGMKNLDEIMTGTDPWDADSVFVLDFNPVDTNESMYVASWPGKTGKQYAFQKADSTFSAYQNVASNIAGQFPSNTLTVVFSDADDIASYRVVQTTDNIRTLNAVGYVRQEFDAGESHLSCLNLHALNGGATVEDIYPAESTVLPSGTVMYFWDPVAQQYSVESLAAIPPPIHWTPGTNEIVTGETFWINIPGSAPYDTYTNYTVGEIPDELSNTVSLVTSGIAFAAYSYPVSVTISNSGLSEVLSYGDTVYFYRDGGWQCESWAYFPPPAHWYPGTNVIEPGRGMEIRSKVAADWVQIKPYTWP